MEIKNNLDFFTWERFIGFSESELVKIEDDSDGNIILVMYGIDIDLLGLFKYLKKHIDFNKIRFDKTLLRIKELIESDLGNEVYLATEVQFVIKNAMIDDDNVIETFNLSHCIYQSEKQYSKNLYPYVAGGWYQNKCMEFTIYGNRIFGFSANINKASIIPIEKYILNPSEYNLRKYKYE